MYETYGAVYVSLHVRVSNVAALALYRDTLGFKVGGTEAKYYADGEDAYSMRMDLDYLRNEALDEESDEEDTVGQDEGGEVGSAGKAGDGSAAAAKKEKKRKVKVGRGLGVGELVERNETSKPDVPNGTS
jgi:N-alpha-acetyltransferase 10/11